MFERKRTKWVQRVKLLDPGDYRTVGDLENEMTEALTNGWDWDGTIERHERDALIVLVRAEEVEA